MSTLERAIEIAAAAHAGQIDKAWQPYILHPIRVMLRVSTDHERMAAVLHDVIEDTPITLEQLVQEGFPDEVIAAVQALTKNPGESRLQAAARASANPIAKVVKLADNAENLDITRIATLTEKDFARLKEYQEVRLLLLASNNDDSTSRKTATPLNHPGLEEFLKLEEQYQEIKAKEFLPTTQKGDRSKSQASSEKPSSESECSAGGITRIPSRRLIPY